MKAVASGLIVSLACSVPLAGQERDRSLERLSLGLQQPAPVLSVAPPVESRAPTTFGIFTLVPPTLGGEMIRVSVPVGELVSRAVKGAGAAKRRRQEAAARRDVEAALARFKAQQPPPKQ